MKTEILICECHSTEHQMIFSYDQEVSNEWPAEVYAHVHLITHRNIFKRILYAVKYVFGYKCRYGAWDEFIFNKEDVKKLEDLVEYLKK